MTHETLDDAIYVTKTDARAGRPVKGMPFVLGVSIAATAVILALSVALFV